MSRDSTFYINHADLVKNEKKIQDDYWKEDHPSEKVWEKLYDISGSNEADLTFKKIKIVTVWWEYGDEVVKFRELLKKYKIEFQED